jgi:hypothetical protein
MSTKQELESVYNTFISSTFLCTDIISIIVNYIDIRRRCYECDTKFEFEDKPWYQFNRGLHFMHGRFGRCENCSMKYF